MARLRRVNRNARGVGSSSINWNALAAEGSGARLLTWVAVAPIADQLECAAPLVMRSEWRQAADMVRLGALMLSDASAAEAESHSPWADRVPSAVKRLNELAASTPPGSREEYHILHSGQASRKSGLGRPTEDPAREVLSALAAELRGVRYPCPYLLLVTIKLAVHPTLFLAEATGSTKLGEKEPAAWEHHADLAKQTGQLRRVVADYRGKSRDAHGKSARARLRENLSRLR